MILWRVIPFDPEADAGRPYSASFIRQPQGTGRFDLSSDSLSVPIQVLYAAEDPEHAVAEKIARFRGSPLKISHLMEDHHRLALIKLEVTKPDAKRIIDLCDPASQLDIGIRSDEVAAAERKVTQRIARRVYDKGFYGLRSWSSIMGEWHTIVLFTDKIPLAKIGFLSPDFLTIDHESVIKAAEKLGMTIP